MLTLQVSNSFTDCKSRGPEIETWFGVEDGRDPAAENDWSFLPFMALSDGAHASVFPFVSSMFLKSFVIADTLVRQIDRRIFIFHVAPTES